MLAGMDPGDEQLPLHDRSPMGPAAFGAPSPPPEDAPGEGSAAHSSRRRRVLVREVVETGLLAVLVFLCVRASFGNYKVEGHSMDPTLADGQYLIVNKLIYARVNVTRPAHAARFGELRGGKRELFSGPQRGDIVILHDPRERAGNELVKRVIGLPGELLEVSAGRVYINGRLLDEPYIHRKWSGDNRDGSADSRYFGLVPRDLIVGKAALRTWPAGEASADFGSAPTLDSAVTRP